VRKTQVILISAILAVISAATNATTKGLNQIVTPDVQPYGVVSISVQGQHPAIGNGLMLQTEIGLTKNFEIAAFYGLRPGLSVLNAEYALVQKGDTLLSAGFTSWTTSGNGPQPFLEGGYNHGRQKYTLGIMHVGNRNLEAILGAAYQVNPKLLLQADYQSGSENFSTVGFTVNLTDTLTLNPSIYVANSSDHSLYGYGVLSWNFMGWK